MRLFVVRSDLAFTLLRPVSEDSWPWRGGAPVRDEWSVPELTVAEGAPERFIPVDCLEMISGTDGFIVSEYGRRRLEPVLGPAGEFWAVRVLGRSYWWFNCLACLQALDRQRTDADWSEVKGEWGAFRWITSTRRLEFTHEGLSGAPALFRVPEYPQGVLFGTEMLETAVSTSELTGFRFDLVWSSARGGVADPPSVGLSGLFDTVDAGELERRRAAASGVLRKRNGSI